MSHAHASTKPSVRSQRAHCEAAVNVLSPLEAFAVALNRPIKRLHEAVHVIAPPEKGNDFEVRAVRTYPSIRTSPR
jgi:hypothetical protein